MSARPELHIGLMSGTSLDGVDGVLVDFSGLPGAAEAASPADGGVPGAPLRILAHDWRPFPAALREELLALNRPGPDELHRAAQAAHALSLLYAECVHALLAHAGVAADAVQSIGAHGQTVRHQPRAAAGGAPYTWQIQAPAELAERSGIDVIADFRVRDLAAGGQGAPLVPAFHRAVFARPQEPVAVLNIGGFANVTLLPARPSGWPAGPAPADLGVADARQPASAPTARPHAPHASGPEAGRLLAFDCGPGNVLMDGWIARHRGLAYDVDGAWAASGRVQPELLARLLAEPYFALPPPKSTGRDDFHLAWLDGHLGAIAACGSLPSGTGSAPADVQATLCELTAITCAQAITAQAPACRRLVVCGGGALNGHLLQRLGAHLPGVTVETSAAAGVPPTQVEAAAFAWLARAHLRGEPGNVPSATGARGPRVLGARYPR